MMDSTVSRYRRRAVGLTVAALLNGTAWAQGPAPSAGANLADGELVVTARRREERSQDVPISLTVLSGDRLERTNVFTLDQAKQQIPSLQITAFNPRNTNINIRNLGSNAFVNGDGLDSGVGVYIDDVYYARPGQSVFDLVDLDRIEVLKGPQGTLFGRNTTAGAISVTTRAPSFTPEARAELSIGNFDYVQARAAVSVPLIDDKLAVRLTASTTRRDGLVTNVRGGRLHNLDSQAVRGQVLIKPTDALSIRLIGDYSIRQENCCVSLVAGVTTTRPDGQAIINNFYDRAARLGYTLPETDPYRRRTDIDAPQHYTVRSYGTSANVAWDLGAATLTSITAWRAWDWLPLNDIDSTGLSVFAVSTTQQRQRQFSQELRLASNGETPVSYVAGLYYFHQKVPSTVLTVYGSDAPEFALPPTVPGALADAALNGFGYTGQSKVLNDSYAGFGQLDWKISDQITLTAGLRFTHERKRGTFDQEQTSGVNLTTLPPALAAAATGLRNNFGPATSFSARISNDSLSGLISAAWKPADGILAYATYARGNKSGGLNMTNLPTGISPAVRPEKVDHFELGLKTSLVPWATVNAALFSTQIRDFQATFADGVRSVTYLTNAAKVRSRGAELDVNAKISRNSFLYAAATYADAKYVKYAEAPCPFGTSTATVCDLSGETLPNAAKWTLSAGGELAQPVGAAELFGGVDWSYRSRFNSASDNTPIGELPGYGIVNARLGIRASDRGWEVYAWARNLLDKKYLTRFGLAPFNSGLLTAAPGDPRTGGVTARFQF